MIRDLDGREYKILLDAASIGTGQDAVETFYRRQLRDLLGRGGQRKVKGNFRASVHRAVRYFDTSRLLLDGAGYALRRRTEDGAADVTLKLRLPDLFVVAASKLEGRRKGAETKFEEDIAPLEVPTEGGGLEIAKPPSIRSRFALSTTQRLGGAVTALGHALELYPTLARNLRRIGLDVDPSAGLLPGPSVREQVFEGPTVDFDGGVRAGVTLTLWELSPAAEVDGVVVDRIAELSYRCGTPNGHMSGKAARAALGLFLDLQRDLRVEARFASKTKLALPRQRDRPQPRAGSGDARQRGKSSRAKAA